MITSWGGQWRSAAVSHGTCAGIIRTRPSFTSSLAAHTLVLYSFENSDPESHANLVFFVKHGMPGCSGCEYIVVLNAANSARVRLPQRALLLPGSAVASRLTPDRHRISFAQSRIGHAHLYHPLQSE